MSDNCSKHGLFTGGICGGCQLEQTQEYQIMMRKAKLYDDINVGSDRIIDRLLDIKDLLEKLNFLYLLGALRMAEKIETNSPATEQADILAEIKEILEGN